MNIKKISLMQNGMRFLLVLFVLAGSFAFPASRMAFAHTFTDNENASFLSLVDQIRAETGLVVKNLESNNAILAQSHAVKASNLLDNSTIREIRERNSRIATTLDDDLNNLEKNVTSLASGSQGQVPQNEIQNINQAVISLNDTLGEAITSRVEREQLDNATVWALALADLTNTVLSNYGNATGSAFDLTNMSNMLGTSSTNNSTMMPNSTSSISNTTTTNIVNTAAYQSAQYLANNSMLSLFNDMLKPLMQSANNIMGNNATTSSASQQVTGSNNVTVSLNDLEANLMQLRDAINNEASPNEIMMIAHTKIHPLLMQIHGSTPE